MLAAVQPVVDSSSNHLPSTFSAFHFLRSFHGSLLRWFHETNHAVHQVNLVHLVFDWVWGHSFYVIFCQSFRRKAFKLSQTKLWDGQTQTEHVILTDKARTLKDNILYNIESDIFNQKNDTSVIKARLQNCFNIKDLSVSATHRVNTFSDRCSRNTFSATQR